MLFMKHSPEYFSTILNLIEINMFKFIMILSIMVIASCGTKQETTEKTGEKNSNQDTVKKNEQSIQKPIYQLSPNQVVIKLNDKDFNNLIGSKFTSWTPEEKDIESAESLIKDCFENMKKGTVNYFLNRSPDEYNHQFVGFIDDKGYSVLWVNCFKRPEEDYPEWKHQIILAQGGGNNFFNLKVNISNNSYYDLKINGNK